MGYALSNSTNSVSINQTCIVCNSSSNCARCLSSNVTQCTSCYKGTYLNGGVCLSCMTGCAKCLSLGQCTACAEGYIPAQSGSTAGNAGNGLLTCQQCSSPCTTCEGSSLSCTSCPNGFSLVGDVCLTNFNYVITVIFDTTLPIFETNYLTFLKQVTTALGVRVSDLVVSSITLGSVAVNMKVTSYNNPGTT